MTHPKVTVIGSINCDISFTVQNFPASNETILAQGSCLSMGGKGLNQAVAAACTGAQTAMIGCVGDDTFGHKSMTYARDNALNTSGLKTSFENPTGTAGILVNQSSDNMIVVAPGANADLTPEDIHAHKALITDADIVVAQMEVPGNAVRAAFDLARKAQVAILFNPAPATPEANALVPYADIITPNESETQTLTGIYPKDEDSAHRAAQALCTMGAKTALITMGATGCYLYTKGHGTLIPAFPVRAIDPTGAGDVFNGVLARCLASGDDLPMAARAASAAGALSVMQAGAEGAAPTWAQIQSFLRQMKPE